MVSMMSVVSVVAMVSAIGRRSVAASLSRPPAGALVRWQALDDPVPGKHAAVDGKVAANHKGAHGCVLLSQTVGLVREIRLVLASIDQNKASVAV